METNLISQLQSLGIDTQAAVERFAGNSALYERFALRFLDDRTMERVEAALAAKNWDGMLEAAHTLKGVAGNLGFTDVYETSSNIVSSLRAGDKDAAEAAYLQLKPAYSKLYSALEKAAKGED